MTDFEREDRYLIFKRTDIDTYLNRQEKNLLELLGNIVEELRDSDGKSSLKAVVVEDDWPEYEDVWAMIEERMKNE